MDSYKILFRIKTYLQLIKIGYKKYNIYKISTILNIVTTFLFVIIQYYLWKAIYFSKQTILNYSFKDMISYIYLSWSINLMLPSLFNPLVSSVKNGKISLYLLKPFSLFQLLFFEQIGSSFYKFITGSIPLLLISIFSFKIIPSITLHNFLIFIIFFIFAFIFSGLLDFLFGLFSFYTLNFWGLTSLKFVIINFFAGKLLPISFYPEILRKVMDFLPFKIILYIPVQILLNKNDVNFLKLFLINIFWCGLLLLIVKVFFKIVLKKISIQGG